MDHPKLTKCYLEWQMKLKRDSLVMSLTKCITQVTKSRRMRLTGHVACMGIGQVFIGFRWGNLREIDHLEDPGVNGIVSRSIFRKWDEGLGLD
jgi:hypothetical protein